MDGGPGRLPRTTFVDDPFFHQDPFDGFPRDGFPRDSGFSRSPQPQRRFGSTPRLIDDEFFDEFGHNMPSAFGSLPRHRHTSRSPQPPTYRGSPSGPQHQQQQQQQNQPQFQERSIPVQRASPNSSSTTSSSSSQQQPATPPSKKSPVPKAAVEINNAASSYTNGELNPDRKQQQPASDSPNANVSTSSSIEPEIQVKHVKIEQATPPQKQQQSEKAGFEDQQQKSSQEKMDTKPPTSNGTTSTGAAAETRRTIFNDKKTSIDSGCSEKLIHLLDEAERRVELLREMASQLEQEKEQILDALHDVKINADFLRLAQHDREDIDATSERLLKRCKAVEVSVFTPRNEDQTRALDEVNKLIEAVTDKIKDDISSAKGTIERYFNACCPDDQPGSVDLRFQAKVIECTADDQKKIRRKLAQIIEQIDRAERVCNPDY